MRGLRCNAPAQAPGGKDVGKGATYSTLVVWLRPLREARHRRHSAAQQSTAKPSTRDGTRQRYRSKQIRVAAMGRGGWEGGS